jgi:hypothetical protein
MFSNSHLSLLPFFASHLAIMRNTWSEWTPSWWFFELALRILASDSKDQSPLHGHLENLLIFWFEWIRSRFAQYVPWVPSSPTNPGYSRYFPSIKATVQLIIYVHCTVCTVYCTYLMHTKINYFEPIISVIVHYSNAGNVFQVFQSHNQHLHS